VIDRRRFLSGASAALLAAPLAAEAQQAQGKVVRVGVLWPGASAPRPPRLEAFREGLRESGYVEGQNVATDLRHAEGRERLRDLATELVRLRVDAITTFGDLGLQIAQRTTSTIPIVALVDDFVGSFARPVGNITGVSILAPELSVKRLELLKEILPRVSRVASLSDPATGTQVKSMEAAARSLGMQLQFLEVRGRDDLARAFQAAKKERAEALHVLSLPLLASLYPTIIGLAAETRLPATYQWKEHVEAGGLLSYGPSLAGVWRQTALVVGKILKGTKPANLPVEQPNKFELVINLKTAKALGLTIPSSLLARADQVIE
jgi:putative tryptophan/tyrosine transport system substrate-binding protein